MESYEEWYARKEDYESKEYERLLEEKKKVKRELHRILNRIKKLGDYVIDFDIDTSLEEQEIAEQIDIIKSMLL